ncbi:hypothetical protein PRIPAC_74029 [Pristionchus pacificus]|uniref:Uncharacterized protein n=1 Tax=Pristionchus pacificus TaxID=54126 RepID=A0A2A6C6E9_PRIPA|nr:hypothetical protein PRIPAC_74029 [Pristionchus pacificus]|eukprot:PDM73744.1 hypothetical protein PRIPAC_41100 [Pristionchus pacificus]
MRSIIIALLALLVAVTAWPWSNQEQQVVDNAGNEMNEIRISSRSSHLPPRYSDLFGSGSSRVQAAFIPQSVGDYTGKIVNGAPINYFPGYTGRVGALRRQTFSWRPQSNDFHV